MAAMADLRQEYEQVAAEVAYHEAAYRDGVPEISDDLPSIDRAVRWGFSHELGPFELWDAIGVRATAGEKRKRTSVNSSPNMIPQAVRGMNTASR